MSSSPSPRERLQLLAGRPLPGAEDLDKVDVEEDSSVLQLLVLTPTDERADAPKDGVVGAAGRPLLWGALKGRRACAGLLRLRVPYFFILVGIVQVTLYRMPSPLEAQELKNRFVWDSGRMFAEPWRTLSYAMLHSGQVSDNERIHKSINARGVLFSRPRHGISHPTWDTKYNGACAGEKGT